MIKLPKHDKKHDENAACISIIAASILKTCFQIYYVPHLESTIWKKKQWEMTAEGKITDNDQKWQEGEAPD